MSGQAWLHRPTWPGRVKRRPIQTDPLPNSELGNLVKGLLFGTVLAVIALAVLTPLIYGPARGASAGVFSSDFGWRYIVGVFLFHWIYGAHIGLIYSPLPVDDPAAAERS